MTQESEIRKIDLSEHDESHVKAMIDYIYKFDYEVKEDASHVEKLCFHVEMCTLGDKYNITELQALSVEKFEVSEFRFSAKMVCLSRQRA